MIDSADDPRDAVDPSRFVLPTSHAERLGLAAIVCIGVGIWLQRIGINDYNDALANEMIFSRSSLATILFHMEWIDQSPLNFVLMHTWLLVFPESPTSIRCINVIIMAACVLVVHAIAKRAHRSSRVALTASLLAATTPMALWLVRDGRMYALQILLAALSILLLLRHADRRRVGDLVGLGLCCVLGIYNHFFGFGVAAIALASLLALEWEEARLDSGPSAARILFRPALVGLGVAVGAIPTLKWTRQPTDPPSSVSAGDHQVRHPAAEQAVKRGDHPPPLSPGSVDR